MLNDVINEEGDRLLLDVLQSQRDKDLVASGRTGRSLRKEATFRRHGASLRLIGSKVFRYLQDGRGPNKSRRPGRKMITDLTEWVKLKGIPVKAVWPIAINIAKNGTQVPNPNNPGGVLSDPLSRSNLQQSLLPKVAAAVRYDVVQQLLGK